MAADMEAHIKQRCITEFLHAEKVAFTDIHQHLLNVYRDQTVNVSTVRQWVRSSSGNSMSAPLVYIFYFLIKVACRFVSVAGENA